VAAIANTAKLNGVWAEGNGTQLGANVINSWNGLAAGPTTWWAAANGGHDQGNRDGWENKVFKLDLAADAPRWTMVHPGSRWVDVSIYSHYADGLPTSRHSYYASQFIAARNRVMQFGVSAPYAIGFAPPAFQGGPNVDGFDIVTSRWDPARTYADAPFSWTAMSVTKHPVTEDVYISARGKFARWTQATNTWLILQPTGLGSLTSWQFHPSVIDPVRNRWVHLNENGPVLQFVDLSTMVGSKLAITGAVTSVKDYSPLVHDLDNDRYVTLQGSNVYTIDPATGVSTLLAMVPRPVNGVHNRFAYFKDLGGIAYLPEFSSNVLFIPTR
jgi:hypothetical protein